MEFISIILILILGKMVYDLRNRVEKLEKNSIQNTVPNLQKSELKTAQVVQVKHQENLNSALTTYINQQQEQGISKEEITKALLEAKWQHKDIENAFEAVSPTFDSISTSNQTQIPRFKTSHVKKSSLNNDASFDNLVKWMSEDWLLKLGALLLLIGFGWLTTYAFMNNWIGPMGRITLGIVAGAMFIILGWWRMKQYVHQGGVFLVLGSTTILLTVFAARTVYGFFTPSAALILMFLSTAFVALASVQYRNRALAISSIILAAFAPMLTASPKSDNVGLFSYLFVIVLGAIWIVALTEIKEVILTALLVVTLYSLPMIGSRDAETLLLFTYAFTTLFFITNTISILKPKNKDITADLVTAAWNGLFLLTWIMTSAQDEWKSLIISAWMIVFLVAAFLIFKITKKREPFYAYAGVGVTMLAAATSAELEGATLTIAYTIESAMVILISYLFLEDMKVTKKLSLLLAGPIFLSLGHIEMIIMKLDSERFYDSEFYQNLEINLNKEFSVLVVLILTFFGLGYFFFQASNELRTKVSEQFNKTLFIIGSIYTYIFIWLFLQFQFKNDNTAVMISLIIYTLVGIISYFYGLTNERKGFKLYGGVMIGLVVTRLFLVDIWEMELAGRITTFFLLGTLLVSTAFLGKKKS